ncbi:MAG: hypothetical protein EBR51_12860, partial [Gammaproteobacteria bacterium]|nr:hypothetical protein [Gammaproteobacteria bacterium]
MRKITPLLLLAVLSSVFAGEPPARPNIIYILSDDLAQGDLGVYGQKLIRTPRLDRMAREGTRFTQAYCGTSVCAPSRTSLITGLHTGHSPVRGNWEVQPEGQLPLSESTVTVAQVLKSAGYATAAMGKWGMGMFDTTGSPLRKGFDRFFGYNCQRHAHSYFPTFLYRDDRRIELPGNDGVGVGPIYAQDLIQREVLDWVRAQRDRPFFLFYAITLPHGRFEINDVGEYRDRPWTAQQKAYAAMVTRLDRDIGQLLDLLAEGRSPAQAVARADSEAGGMTAGCNPMHRAAPLAIALVVPDDGIEDAARRDAAITHAHALAGAAAAAAATLLRLLVRGTAWDDAATRAADGRDP